jgi:hypothetical protein
MKPTLGPSYSEDPVVTAAQLAFSVRLKDSSDVSENTKSAQAIAKAYIRD